LRWMIGNLWNKFFLAPAAKVWQKSQAKYLRKYGLKFDDTLDEATEPNVKRAVELLSPELRLARQRRILRAVDLSLKKEHLPKELQENYDPFDHYLWPIVNKLNSRDYDRKRVMRL